MKHIPQKQKRIRIQSNIYNDPKHEHPAQKLWRRHKTVKWSERTNEWACARTNTQSAHADSSDRILLIKEWNLAFYRFPIKEKNENEMQSESEQLTERQGIRRKKKLECGEGKIV